MHSKSAAAGQHQGFYTCALKLIFTCTANNISRMRHALHAGSTTRRWGPAEQEMMAAEGLPLVPGRRGACWSSPCCGSHWYLLHGSCLRQPLRSTRPLEATQCCKMPPSQRRLQFKKKKHFFFQWIRRTLQLNDCLISKTGVTPASTCSTCCSHHPDYSWLLGKDLTALVPYYQGCNTNDRTAAPITLLPRCPES